MVIEHRRLADRAWILQLEDALLLYTQHDDIAALDAHRTGALVDGLERVLDLEEMAVGREDRQG